MGFSMSSTTSGGAVHLKFLTVVPFLFCIVITNKAKWTKAKHHEKDWLYLEYPLQRSSSLKGGYELPFNESGFKRFVQDQDGG